MNRLILFLALALSAQDAKPSDSKVDQKQVDAAIKKGIDVLKKASLDPFTGDKDSGSPEFRFEELVLWTFIHAGVPESDPVFQKHFKTMLDAKLERTYQVALQAMILEELDRVRWQPRILACAQFLLDNQSPLGYWGYGEASFAADSLAGKARDVATGPAKADVSREKPKVVKRVPVKKSREGSERGDNSNSQYAMLGLRACFDAGIVLPKEPVKLAQKWWRDSQNTDKASSGGRGWSYVLRDFLISYGSMTAGAVGSLIICDYLLGEDWRRDKEVKAGLDWLSHHFTVKENPGPPPLPPMKGGVFYYYYLYALERAGILYGTETFGTHEWYAEGARAILAAQKKDGTWASADLPMPVWDTCFAILFLRRATRALEDVVTEDKRKK